MTISNKGIELIEELPGHGPAAETGATVIYSTRLFLRRGEEVTADSVSIAAYGERLSTRVIEDVELIEHTTVLGKRQSIAAIEKSLLGMQANGYREVIAAPHLCYGERGVEGLIPANARLRIRLWLHEINPVD